MTTDHADRSAVARERVRARYATAAGQVRAGFVADRWSVRGAIVSGGVSCVAGVAITATWLHDFWAYDERTDEHALAERRARYRAANPADPAAS